MPMSVSGGESNDAKAFVAPLLMTHQQREGLRVIGTARQTKLTWPASSASLPKAAAASGLEA